MTRDDIIALVTEYNTLLEAYEDATESASDARKHVDSLEDMLRNARSYFTKTRKAATVAEYKLREFEEKYPAIDYYDSKGNYIGPVRNENGWTP